MTLSECGESLRDNYPDSAQHTTVYIQSMRDA